MITSSLEEILEDCSGLGDPVRVTGLEGSSRAWLLLRYSRRFGGQMLVFCPDEEVASELANDLEELSRLIPPSKGEDDPAILLFPGFDRSLFTSISPSIRSRLQRAGALSQLLQRRRSSSPSPSIVLTTLQSALLRTIPPEVLERTSVPLRAGMSIGSREELVSRLVAAGYTRADSVEDPGNFSVRGEIIDIYLPAARGDGHPVRIELFDDVIERIRAFDPRSQRSVGESLETIIVGPCREVLINSETSSRLRSNLKRIADDLGISRTFRDPLLEQISSGIPPEFSETWAFLAYDQQATLLDHLQDDFHLLVDDDLECQQSFDLLLSECRDSHARLIETPSTLRRLVCAPDVLFGDVARNIGRLFQRARLLITVMEVTAPAELPDHGIDETPDARPRGRHRVAVRLNQDLTDTNQKSLEVFRQKVLRWREQRFQVVVCAPTDGQAERLQHLLSSRLEDVVCFRSSLTSGFRWPAERLAVVTETEILGEKRTSGSKSRSRSGDADSDASESWAGLQALADLSPGDTIVHVDHGIGRFQGMVRLELSGAAADFLLLEYANRDRLYLPVYRLNLIQKHGAAGDSAALDRLGSQQFQKTRDRVKESVRKLAVDLVRLYAERKIRQGFRFSGRDALFEEFEAKFPYEETPDQARAIDSTIDDMQQGRIMDRLICGDVGYGKTEVAIRAAFRAACDGKQVAVLVPTTILAHQHEVSFKRRLLGTAVQVESISRFKSKAEQKAVLGRLSDGGVDIIIGTHRLLSKDIRFKDLGLLVIDEEHRFGVDHKEKLKALKASIPVLTLSATPIPRTLHMSLSGLRDISLIQTPPVNRLPIRTFVSQRDDEVIRKALDYEITRGGQAFFLHNRVQTIQETARRLHELVPAARITVAHGQMSEAELESAIAEFYEKRSNVLVCTTIIESGIDLPSANTIIVDRADTFGLAQLYQIRGRVGRGDQRAYAYLLVPPNSILSDDAKKRLDVIQRFVELGSGFQIASHDLEIRGGGELLGPQQSGNIQAVGFDLYLELLEEAVREIRDGVIEEERRSNHDPEIKAPFPAFLAENYVPDLHHRLSLYRKLSSCASDQEVDSLEEELRDRFGRLPEEATNLLWLIRCKVHLKRLKIDAVTAGRERIVLIPGSGSSLDPIRAIALVSAHPSRYQLTPDSKFVATYQIGSMKDLYFRIQELSRDLGGGRPDGRP